MSVEDMKPEGFDESMRIYANFAKPWGTYVQGMALRECAVWLNVGGVETMIGLGEPDAALAEAEAALNEQIANIRRQIANRKLMASGKTPNV